MCCVVHLLDDLIQMTKILWCMSGVGDMYDWLLLSGIIHTYILQYTHRICLSTCLSVCLSIYLSLSHTHTLFRLSVHLTVIKSLACVVWGICGMVVCTEPALVLEILEGEKAKLELWHQLAVRSLVLASLLVHVNFSILIVPFLRRLFGL